MAATYFENADERYLSWAALHPAAYVLNLYAEDRPSYRILHRASCRFVYSPPRPVLDGGFTGRRYRKVGADTKEEILNWVSEHRGGTVSYCGSCFPAEARTRQSHPAEVLRPGQKYHRKDLQEQFGGQLQSGIWTPTKIPAIFLFTGASGEAYGYQDGFEDDGTFRYTGEGQLGDMQFSRGNRAIRDHKLDGKDILLFSTFGKGKAARYEGLFECAAWEHGAGADREGSQRQIIVFHLIPVSSPALAGDNDRVRVVATGPQGSATQQSLGNLRAAAYAAAAPSRDKQDQIKMVASVWRQRRDQVKAYVLARAGGVCEACDLPAPFKREDGTDYLEPHHTERLADDGPDHPAWVGAICPNCHRRIHSGIDGPHWNRLLAEKVRAKEAAAGITTLLAQSS